MLRHTGQKRSFQHNMPLAILLCLNAGFINAAGFLAFSVLTTNVTGHAALLAINIATKNLRSTRMVGLWLFLFLGGAFLSGFYISKAGRNKPFAYTVPIVFIVLILLFVAIFGHNYNRRLAETEYFAGSLLFAMGVQNAMVSLISGSVVRTTHLTGMFTDLGIDLSEAAHSGRKLHPLLKRRILLRLAIIISFLSGGVLGSLLFLRIAFTSFFVPVCFLLLALFYDYFRIKVTRAISRSATFL
ncbi:MAG: YoaK family protein [Chitinophagaceae bacterium]